MGHRPVEGNAYDEGSGAPYGAGADPAALRREVERLMEDVQRCEQGRRDGLHPTEDAD